jgi:hypothetical protein
MNCSGVMISSAVNFLNPLKFHEKKILRSIGTGSSCYGMSKIDFIKRFVILNEGEFSGCISNDNRDGFRSAFCGILPRVQAFGRKCEFQAKKILKFLKLLRDPLLWKNSRKNGGRWIKALLALAYGTVLVSGAGVIDANQRHEGHPQIKVAGALGNVGSREMLVVAGIWLGQADAASCHSASPLSATLKVRESIIVADGATSFHTVQGAALGEGLPCRAKHSL